VVIAVGKLKERGIREAADDYLKRIGRYAKVEEIELKDAAADELEPRFAKAIPDRALVVALEVTGRAMSSDDLARFVGRAESDGATGTLCFLIGGAYGLPPGVSKRAALRLSLSSMTLPHRLARLLLLEQVYRAFTILRGEPYSH
jgi:23S rRNA (pseudouridine1915-N3)-methyltransferase